MDTVYYSPTSIEVSVEGRYEPHIIWFIGGQAYSSQDNPHLTPTISSVWSGSKKTFNLAFNMSGFETSMSPFTVRGTVSFGDATDPTFDTVTTNIYKREFVESLPASTIFRNADIPKAFLCSASGEDKELLTLSWKIGDVLVDDEVEHVTLTDESDSSSTTTKISKLTITTNKPTFNAQFKCIATWSGVNGKSIESTTDVNAVGVAVDENTFSTGSSGDGVISCVVWGDSPPYSVTWSNEREKAITNQPDETEIADSITEGITYTHTLTVKKMTFGDQGKYTCSVVFVENETLVNVVTTLIKLSARFEPATPYFVHEKTVQFSCVYNGLDDPQKIEWFRSSTDDAETLISNSDAKYTIATGNFNKASRTKTSVITVENVEVTDSGDYTCKWTTCKLQS
ncbi:roundabout homolog 1-like [Bolinopsis microptera]|uniref:roundabout homolog 1-like n=1 Tax=Bolinopsis microptera TaxID=2820187 RepID=UPI00307925DB